MAIGAPKEDDFSGAVYIYHGDAGGIVPQYSMVIGVRVTWYLFVRTFIRQTCRDPLPCATSWGTEDPTRLFLPLAFPPSSERQKQMLLLIKNKNL